MTTTTARPVSVAELKHAWRALQASPALDERPYAAGLARADTWPPVGGRVIPVVGCGGGVGASTLALALAEVAGAPCRLIDCAPPAASALAGASTAELGDTGSGWRLGQRDDVLIERVTGSALTPSDVPAPRGSEVQLTLTVVDVAWPLEAVLAHASWLRELLVGAEPVVLATTATLPGMRRLETTLAVLAQHRDVSQTVVAVLGPRLQRWPKPVRHSMGPSARSLQAAGRLVAMPFERRLASTGPDPAPLPAPVLAAAARVNELLPTSTAMTTAPKGSTP